MTSQRNSKGKSSRAPKSFDNWINSWDKLLGETTALEVNTMVVEHITGEKFIAWETYRELYMISRKDLQNQGIHESLRDRYLELRTNIEREYASLLRDPNSELYDSEQARNDTKPRLPDPTQTTIQTLLRNARFLRCLRKLGELKAALDHRNQAFKEKESETSDQVSHKAVKTDFIYAQTVMQLDSDIINRYSQEIFDHSHKELILQIHREGVQAAGVQWRGLLGFIVDMIERVGKRNTSNSTS